LEGFFWIFNDYERRAGEMSQIFPLQLEIGLYVRKRCIWVNIG
jgi:hypothetical protein